MTGQQELIINELHDKLLAVLPFGSVALLYGSQARGDFRPDSDWDILIIVDHEKVSLAENTAITYPIIMFGWAHGLEINPILYTKSEWEACQNTPFVENVKRDALQIA